MDEIEMPEPQTLISTRHLLIVDKPAGLPVQPARAGGPSIEALFATAGGGGHPAFPAHRLDRDTSGCLLLARSPSALRRLSALFSEREVEKVYHAVVENAPPGAKEGVIDAPLGKVSSREAGWRMEVQPSGKAAKTHWRVLMRSGNNALIEFRPLTGRTHQIRVHATLLGDGAAIVGDRVYGTPSPEGMMLHASMLAFLDPWTDEPISVSSPLPRRFTHLGIAPE